MRWHPARQLMAQGVAVTISSDDSTFWNYQGISLDFTYAFIAWQLNLKDVKQLAINSIKQSSIEEELKPRYIEKFHRDWEGFITQYLENSI
jgi:adenosine deaminase